MIEVAAAIIEDRQGRILIARKRRGKAQKGLWEFPGGKLEPGETPEACLKRELLEEMGLRIRPYARFGVSEHRYEEIHIRLTAYRAVLEGGEPVLTDHDRYEWVHPSGLGAYEFAAADIEFVDKLML
ncbi:(deoxy)nucleoside triphosphate pyrophosphohydrolase [Paenibacillus spiritus]|uniref:8-oxo-dGTP diphosphatase n=1 Tax=Paenibacillus spiritus TaxID=2496557 RepID=A0A5J5G5T1_9BACL|nr:(deoxy)nucleoside triphosphate pyrophosphohydrolase [Paenibacillus spiritus]KAA9002433.1 (deoxy)nucleoside triphosphate pyrophosphohydrolase [Paenibacillus spiritus]